jgi:hypothetical protein
MESSERISESQATLEKVVSSVLFDFEVRSELDPNNVANFKFGTLEGGGNAKQASQKQAL